jgi:4,5-DOPA dioxygenase extradiol
MMMPSLFISHGAPDLVLHDLPARRFLSGYGAELPAPSAICVISAHYPGAQPLVTTGPAPRTVHDFGGFDPALYTLRYPAPGAPALAARLIAACADAGLQVFADAQGGFDHGVWCPLLLMYPAAAVPVVGLSVCPRRDAAWHFALGRALAPLRAEGVLVIGSGALTHNLYEVRPPAGFDEAPAWVDAFADWVGERLAAQDEAALLDYRTQAPHAADNHPSSEHLLPFHVALGAAGPGWCATRLHRSVTYRALRMDAFRFDS